MQNLTQEQNVHPFDLQPPLPDCPVVNYKKGGPEYEDSIKLYLEQLLEFAKATGVWQAVIDALAGDSGFTNLSSHPLKNTEHLQPPTGSGQGLVVTGYEETYSPDLEVIDLMETNPEMVDEILYAWLYHLALFNHPEHLDALYKVAKKSFKVPKKRKNKALKRAKKRGESVSILELAMKIPEQTKYPRMSRTKILTLGGLYFNMGRIDKDSEEIFGRMQARNVIVAGENPDITGSPLMLASMAAAHRLVGIPRDGFFKKIERQAKLASETLKLLEELSQLFGRSKKERDLLLDWYKHNLVGVVEVNQEPAIERAQALYDAGVRTFRVYSPEPNDQLVETVKALRRHQKEQGWEPIEIFAGQVVSVNQAKELEDAGCDANYIGVGGGGRCITGNVANLAIDWPQLLWSLRGKIKIPVIVQGGANDNPATTIALGGSGIGAVGAMGGSLESPGGTLYFYDPKTGEIFKFYGGEASNRMRVMANRKDPLGRTINKEGEATRKPFKNEPDQGVYATAQQRLAEMLERISTGLGFQNARNIRKQQKRTKNVRREAPIMSLSRNPHDTHR